MIILQSGTTIISGSKILLGTGLQLTEDSTGIPQIQLTTDVGTFINGGGSAGYIPRWTDTDTLGDSSLRDDGSLAAAGGAVESGIQFKVYGALRATGIAYLNEKVALGANGSVADSSRYLDLRWDTAPLTTTTQYGAVIRPSFGSAATVSVQALYTRADLVAGSYTVPIVRGIYVENPSLGLNAVATEVVGLFVASMTAGGTRNYAIRTNTGWVRLDDRVGVKADPNLLLDVRTGATGAWADYALIGTSTGTADQGGLLLGNSFTAASGSYTLKIASTFNASTSARARIGFVENNATETWVNGPHIELQRDGDLLFSNAGWQINTTSFDSLAGTGAAVLLRAVGSASAPGFTFSGNTNLGLYRISADILGIATNGAERVRISQNTYKFTGVTSAENQLNGPASTSKRYIMMTNSGFRWYFGCDELSESDPQNGSNFSIGAYSNAGGFLSEPVFITRSTGRITLRNGLSVVTGNDHAGAAPTVTFFTNVFHATTSAVCIGTTTPSGSNKLTVSGTAIVQGAFEAQSAVIQNGSTGGVLLQVGSSTAAGPQLEIRGTTATSRDILWSTAGSARWVFRTGAGAESGSNAGSDFEFRARDDTGADLGTVWTAVRSSRLMTISRNLGLNGAAAVTYYGINSGNTLTGDTTAYGFVSNYSVASDVTAAYRALFARVNTTAAAFTLASAQGLYISNPSLGSGSAITTAHGVYIESQTAAGTNYAIYTNLGPVRFGDRASIGTGSPVTDRWLEVAGTGLTGTAQYGASFRPLGSTAATAAVVATYHRAETAAAVFTTAAVRGIQIADAIKGSGSTITAQYGLWIDAQTQGDTNYAIYTHAGRVRLSDVVGVLGDPATNVGVQINGTLAGDGVNAWGVRSILTVSGALTNTLAGFVSEPATAAAAITIANVRGFWARNATKGSGSTITEQVGVYVDSQTQGATNYAIYTNTGLVRLGDAASVTSTSSTALAVGANGTTNPVLQVNASAASVATGLAIVGAAAGSALVLQTLSSGTNEPLHIKSKGSSGISLFTNGTERWKVDENGHFRPGADNTYDVGFTGTTRPRTIYVGTNVIVGTSVASTGAVRLENAATISWRNAGNSANISLSVAATDRFLLGSGLDVNSTTITSALSTALVVGANGTTNPVFRVNAATASVATGLEITGAAAAGGLAIAVISSGTNENLTINAKGSGTITLGNTSTGAITLARATTVSAGNLAVTNGELQIGAGSGTLGQWRQVWDDSNDRLYMGFAGTQGGTIQLYPNGTSNGATVFIGPTNNRFVTEVELDSYLKDNAGSTGTVGQGLQVSATGFPIWRNTIANVGSGDAKAGLGGSGTYASYVDSNPSLSGAPSAPSAPTVTAGYKSVIIDTAPQTITANEKWRAQWSTVSDFSSNVNQLPDFTGSKLVHSGLTLGTTYYYRLARRGASDSAYSGASSGVQPSNAADVTAFSLVTASQISTVTLAALSVDTGILTSGLIQSAASNPKAAILLNSGYTLPATATSYIDFTAAEGSDPEKNIVNFAGNMRVTQNGAIFVRATVETKQLDITGGLTDTTAWTNLQGTQNLFRGPIQVSKVGSTFGSTTHNALKLLASTASLQLVGHEFDGVAQQSLENVMLGDYTITPPPTLTNQDGTATANTATTTDYSNAGYGDITWSSTNAVTVNASGTDKYAHNGYYTIAGKAIIDALTVGPAVGYERTKAAVELEWRLNGTGSWSNVGVVAVAETTATSVTSPDVEATFSTQIEVPALLTVADTGSTTLNINASLELTRAAGSFLTDGFTVGQTIQLSGFTNGGNNVNKVIATVAATTITFTSTAGLVQETGGGNERAQWFSSTLDIRYGVKVWIVAETSDSLVQAIGKGDPATNNVTWVSSDQTPIKRRGLRIRKKVISGNPKIHFHMEPHSSWPPTEAVAGDISFRGETTIGPHFYDGSAWQSMVPGAPSSHVLASDSGLGSSHTITSSGAGKYLRTTGTTTAAFQVIAVGDLPTITVAKGGLNMTTVALGELLYGSAADTYSRLAGNTTTTKKFLTQTGNGSVSAAPVWGTIVAADVTAGSDGQVLTTTGSSTGWAAPTYRETRDDFYQDGILTGTQSATVMPRLTAAGFSSAFIPIRGGSITGVAVRSVNARTAGSLTVEVYKNGVATGLTAVLDGTNTTFKATTQASGLDTFAAGDRLELYLTTASWTPVATDLRAMLEVTY